MEVFDKSKVHVVSFSGGRTSAYLVHLMEQKRKELGIQVDYIFCDTGAEHPRTYDFVRQVADHFSINLTCLRAEFSMERGVGAKPLQIGLDEIGSDLKPFSDMCEKYGAPAVHAPFCTDRMKLQPFNKYCDARYGKRNYVRWLGIRIDEPNRLKLFDDGQIDMFGMEPPKEAPYVRYLAHISEFEKDDILSWWAGQPFDLQIEEHLGNCVFCIKKGLNKIALAAKDEPEMAAEFIKMVDRDCVPQRNENFAKNVIYRDHYSLAQVINIYDGVARDEIIVRMKNAHQYDTGSCSESCEAMPSEEFMLTGEEG